MKFSPVIYRRLKSRLDRRYDQRLKHLLGMREARGSKTHTWLREHKSEFVEYSSLKWYFLEQVGLLFNFMALPADLSQGEVFSAQEDEVFERWNKSEFADVFLKQLNKGQSVGKASQFTAAHLDRHLVQLGNRHILKIKAPLTAYRPQTSLGDYLKGKTTSKLLETTLHLENKELVLMTKTLKEMKDFSSRIDRALQIIREFSPGSWERFQAFTEVIIPIKQEEFVSYSHQELPGTSMINLYHRDFVDLLDDLIHENGHHHLNYYLNLGRLIEEPIDNLYYSPWRRTLRPLRGIYHAYFTFFWAFKLFADLAEHSELKHPAHTFSNEEKEKILWRAVEEFHMLSYSYKDLVWARRHGLIADEGWALVQDQWGIITKMRRRIGGWEKKLRLHRQELRDLKKVLIQASKSYKKA